MDDGSCDAQPLMVRRIGFSLDAGRREQYAPGSKGV